MPILLLLSDFKGGKYDIPDAGGVYTNANVQALIDAYEKQYIYQLLGVTEGDKFIAWIAANRLPANADYSKIENPFSVDNPFPIDWDYDYAYPCPGSMLQSLGMKEYLKAGVFYEYIKNGLLTSQAGVTKPESETAHQQIPSSTMRFAENKFNDVLDTVASIQWYCLNTSTAFPDFNGQRIRVKASNIL